MFPRNDHSQSQNANSDPGFETIWEREVSVWLRILVVFGDNVMLVFGIFDARCHEVEFTYSSLMVWKESLSSA